MFKKAISLSILDGLQQMGAQNLSWYVYNLKRVHIINQWYQFQVTLD